MSIRTQQARRNENFTLIENPFKRNGYDFIGWSKNKNSSTAEYPSQSITNFPNDITLYAIWQIRQYIVTFNGNGGQPESQEKRLDYNQELGDLPTASRIGYDFNDWWTTIENGNKVVSTTKVTKDISYYAHWTPIEYNISYSLGKPNVQNPNTRTTFTIEDSFTPIPLPNVVGYTFSRWEPQEIRVGTHEDQTFVAKWNLNKHKLTYDGNGGTPDNVILTIDYNQVVNELQQVSRVGYNFVGWEDSNGNIKTSITMPDEDVRLLAKWNPISYTIRFNPNGGQGNMSDQNMTYDQKQELSQNEFTKVGYDFSGWATSEGDDPSYMDKQEIMNLTFIDNDLFNLYAKWIIKRYLVNFNKNYGTSTSYGSVELTHGQQLGDQLKTIEREDWDFKGWNTKQDGSGEWVDETTEITSSLTVYAQWYKDIWKPGITFNWKQKIYDGAGTLTNVKDVIGTGLTNGRYKLVINSPVTIQHIDNSEFTTTNIGGEIHQQYLGNGHSAALNIEICSYSKSWINGATGNSLQEKSTPMQFIPITLENIAGVYTTLNGEQMRYQGQEEIINCPYVKMVSNTSQIESSTDNYWGTKTVHAIGLSSLNAPINFTMPSYINVSFNPIYFTIDENRLKEKYPTISLNDGVCLMVRMVPTKQCHGWSAYCGTKYEDSNIYNGSVTIYRA